MIRFERTRLGPRLYVLGTRVHECYLGAFGLAVLAIGGAFEWWGLTAATGLLALAGAWLVVKDWRDIFPRLRDTSMWRLGMHRLPTPLRVSRRGDWIPPLTAGLTALVALVSLGTTLAPRLSLFGRPVLSAGPVALVPAVHATVLPAAGALLLISVYLLRRRRRAYQLALAILLGLTAGNLLKGLQVEDAFLASGAAAVLLWGRDSFHVRHNPVSLRSVLWRVPLLALAALALAGVAVWATVPGHANPGAVVRETLDLLLWTAGPLRFGDEFAWLPYGVGVLSLLALLVSGYLVFRPLAAPRGLPDARARRAAGKLVRAHGTDTLSFFKLRADEHYLFSPDGRAFAGYRVENGVLLLSGDPVGPAEALPALLREVCVLAELRGLRIGGIGAGASLLPLWAQAGVRSLYVGDEAIVDTGAFSLEGRAIRKVRQSVSRLESAGYRAELSTIGSLDDTTLSVLEEVSERWRGGASERGFSMAMDSLRGEHLRSSLVCVARDEEGVVRGFVHFVPVYRRLAVSLSIMRRDRDTPNGLMEFLVVSSIGLLRERGVEEVSLNFAAFARWMHAPRTTGERLLGSLVGLANPWFQIESLYRFNAKFFPRWEPRYLLYEGRLALPRVSLAALRAEGQIPKPKLRPAAPP